jgi:1-acyl-sn-glycerol-3-phosphate acyltransferase
VGTLDEARDTTLVVDSRYPYPRRRLIRGLLQSLARVALATLADLRIVGRENFPEEGPLLVVANHFSYIDPVAIVGVAPWPMEFIGGFHMPNAPASVTWLPKLWGYYPVYRGSASREALRASEAVLAQRGVVGIFPEAGSWAAVLRPARPGTAFLAARTGARLMPMGLDGLIDVFPYLSRGRRACVTLRIGEPFGPFRATGNGRAQRQQLEAISNEIMGRIAELIPRERRGYYSDDLSIRATARGTEIYPWADAPEG